MTPSASTRPSPIVLVVGPDPWRGRAADELAAALEPPLHVRAAGGADDTADLFAADTPVALLVVVAGDAPVDETVVALVPGAGVAAPRTLLVTDRDRHDDVATVLDRGLLDAVVTAPWSPGSLAEHVRAQLARWRLAADDDPASVAAAGPPARAEVASVLLRDLELDEVAVADRLTAGIDRALGRRPLLHVPAGTRLTRQDRHVDGVFVVRTGSVALYRNTAVGELRLHHASTGPMIGLLSLTQQRRAYFTARATTDVEVVHLTVEQLDAALTAEPDVGAALATVAMRALAVRLRRSEQLQIERIRLNTDLEAERRRLSEALAALEAARLELVEQARFATLGELAAGIAHELNNPVAALGRAASYVAEDVDVLLAGHSDATLVRATLHDARRRPPTSTADERAARRTLTDAVGDPELARRLVAAGVTDPDRARELARHPDRLAVVERAGSLGTAVRNLEVAAGRIADLVRGLRAYARPDQAAVDGVDLHAGLDDTLRLVAHQLQGVEVDRRYGTLPPIRAHPGQLSQVWTNLLVNAAEALGGRGRIEVVTDAPDADHVRVRVVDDGPGIPADVRARLFEPRFTTKGGAVRYGLGLGLPIARRLVEGHGGTIDVTSEPGRTVLTVTLPVAGPDAGDREEDAT